MRENDQFVRVCNFLVKLIVQIKKKIHNNHW